MNNSEPIGRFGTEWQKFMKENYPETWNLLRKQYAEKNPRPKTFTEIVGWEKTRSLYVEHEVMEQVVLCCRSC